MYVKLLSAEAAASKKKLVYDTNMTTYWQYARIYRTHRRLPDRLGCLVSSRAFALSAGGRWFDPRSGQAEDWKIDTCCCPG